MELLLDGTGDEPGVGLGERAKISPDECRLDLNLHTRLIL